MAIFAPVPARAARRSFKVIFFVSSRGALMSGRVIVAITGVYRTFNATGSLRLVYRAIPLEVPQRYALPALTNPTANAISGLASSVASSSADWVELSASPLSADAAVGFVTDPAAGGIDLFLGTTRFEKTPDGRDLLRLDYEAYPEMALQQMRDLAARARRQWRIIKLALLHRTGAVAPGEPS